LVLLVRRMRWRSWSSETVATVEFMLHCGRERGLRQIDSAHGFIQRLNEVANQMNRLRVLRAARCGRTVR